jgi:hypothetical protein
MKDHLHEKTAVQKTPDRWELSSQRSTITFVCIANQYDTKYQYVLDTHEAGWKRRQSPSLGTQHITEVLEEAT